MHFRSLQFFSASKQDIAVYTYGSKTLYELTSGVTAT